jgi:hypothetical protein
LAISILTSPKVGSWTRNGIEGSAMDDISFRD